MTIRFATSLRSLQGARGKTEFGFEAARKMGGLFESYVVGNLFEQFSGKHLLVGFCHLQFREPRGGAEGIISLKMPV